MIEENLAKIRKEIDNACRRAGRSPEEVLLIAVSKTKPPAAIRAALAAGQVHFGENRAQELARKMEEFDDSIRWHMIGTLQTNKIKYLISRVDWIDSVHKVGALREIEKRAASAERAVRTLIQVNISGESQKSGCEPEKLPELLRYARELKWVRVCGLMGIAALKDDPEEVRPQFRALRLLRDEHRGLENARVTLDHLSMGMSHDFRVAVEEGSTMVRIGTAIFGTRDYVRKK